MQGRSSVPRKARDRSLVSMRQRRKRLSRHLRDSETPDAMRVKKDCAPAPVLSGWLCAGKGALVGSPNPSCVTLSTARDYTVADIFSATREL